MDFEYIAGLHSAKKSRIDLQQFNYDEFYKDKEFVKRQKVVDIIHEYTHNLIHQINTNKDLKNNKHAKNLKKWLEALEKQNKKTENPQAKKIESLCNATGFYFVGDEKKMSDNLEEIGINREFFLNFIIL